MPLKSTRVIFIDQKKRDTGLLYNLLYTKTYFSSKRGLVGSSLGRELFSENKQPFADVFQNRCS